jgi:hypothetical protein
MSKMKDKVVKWLKEPVVQFMIIGLIMFLINTLILQTEKANEEEEYKIYLKSSEVNAMAEMWESRWNRPPTKEEMEGLINQRVEETILFKEAIKIGLDKNDDIIRQRMSQKLEFLSNDLSKADSATLEEIQVYFETNIDKYTKPESITFVQLFVNPNTHGDLLDEEVERRLNLLSDIEAASPEINKYSDPFSLQSYFPSKSQLELSKLFGSEFAASVFDLESDQWLGPVDSQYGEHLVYVIHKNPAVTPNFESINEIVISDLQREKQAEVNELYIKGILSRYEVIIEETEEK